MVDGLGADFECREIGVVTGFEPGNYEFEARHSSQNRQFSARKLAVFLLLLLLYA
jgi:hypothetical protein